MEKDFEIPESVTNVTLSKANWPYRREDMTDCHHCAAMREAAVKAAMIAGEQYSRNAGNMYARRSGRSAATACVNAIRALPCQCPPLEGGLTREDIENYRSWNAKVFIGDLNSLCDMALRAAARKEEE